MMMEDLECSFTATLYRPYFDLGPSLPEGTFHVFSIDFDYLTLVEGKEYPRLQNVLMPSYRDALIQETGLFQYQVDTPLDLAPELRTERWQRLCEYLDHYQELSPVVKQRVLRLLGRLCFYQAILQLEPQEISLDAIAREEGQAQIAYVQAMSRFVFSMEASNFLYSPDEMKRIALYAPEGSTTRLLALYQMVVQHVKYYHDRDAVEYWLPLYYQQIQLVKSEVDDFTYQSLMSRYHRVAGFAPQMRRDKEGVIREMDLAEQYARNLRRQDTFQSIAANEMLYALLESRGKEAIWLGDLTLAETRTRERIALSPLDPRSYVDLGQVLLEQDKIEAAAQAYRTAARLGPHGTEVSYFMLGQCYEALEQLELAREAYLAALRIDPLGVSSAERLLSVAGQLEDRVLVRWCSNVLNGLQTDAEEEKQLRPYQNMPAPLSAS